MLVLLDGGQAVLGQSMAKRANLREKLPVEQIRIGDTALQQKDAVVDERGTRRR